MIPASLILLAIAGFGILLVAGIVMIIFTNHQRETTRAVARNQEFIQRQQTAVWASAMVISARGGVITGGEGGVSEWARYDLTLEVTPPGGAPYVVHAAWLVQVAQMSLVQQGKQISIKIDQQDPKIIYPNGDWAKYLPA